MSMTRKSKTVNIWNLWVICKIVKWMDYCQEENQKIYFLGGRWQIVVALAGLKNLFLEMGDRFPVLKQAGN
ncbi:hypothetical protein PUN28_018457 [Cardiocondyla obscurior]|uniref:Uncharacterized protein n=1 Tax=Cardiocondyla obscurior TaxID=286306 RepID=A0AAW2EFC3_9HYME